MLEKQYYKNPVTLLAVRQATSSIRFTRQPSAMSISQKLNFAFGRQRSNL